MPIYEFYCTACHTLFNFLSRRIDTKSCPPCPRCQQALSREVSLFAAACKGGASGGDGGEGEGGELPADDSRIEQAMEKMSGAIESIDENDPRQAARVMRQFAEASGMRFNAAVDEALTRMETGEDPEALEAELGDALDSDNPFETEGAGKPGGGARQRRGPVRDPGLYDM